MDVSFNTVLSSISQTGKYFYKELGDFGLNPGFMQKSAGSITLITLVVPLAINAFQFLRGNYQGQDPFNLSAKEIREHVVTYLNSNKVTIITSLFVATLFVLFSEIPTVVYVGYSAISIAHAYETKRDYDNGSKMDFIKHLFAAATSFSTLGAMITGRYEARWHHMSYGLLAMLPNLTTLNSFGTCMVVDSILYLIKPNKDDFDFSNIFVNNIQFYVLQLTVLTTYEIGKCVFQKPLQKAPVVIT